MSVEEPGVQDNTISDRRIGRAADWQAVFGNDRPVQIEIGPGKGTVLLQLAQIFPEHNLLGIEWAAEFYRHAARRSRFWKAGNVKLLRTDAREFLIDRVPTASVLAVHAYFADPWPKSRHAGRRLFIPEFCRAAARVLKPGGKVFAATDHQPYGEEIHANLSAVPQLREADHRVLEGRSLETLESNYEAKFVKEGRKISRMAFERV